jgi:uncharacterized protein with HEPN domain
MKGVHGEKHSPERLVAYLEHICAAILKIEAYVQDVDEVAFLNSTLLQDAVARNFEIIGEASHNIERDFPAFAAQNPDIPLAVAYQMRNVIAHAYFSVDYELVWKTIYKELPTLFRQVQVCLTAMR